jgi:hypothetical protein
LYKLIAPAPFGADQETGKSRRMLRSQFEPDECNITSAGSMVNPNIAEGPLNHGPPSIAIPSVRRLLSNQLPHVFCGNYSGPLTPASTTGATHARTVGNSDPRFFLRRSDV